MVLLCVGRFSTKSKYIHSSIRAVGYVLVLAYNNTYNTLLIEIVRECTIIFLLSFFLIYIFI